MNTLYEVEYKYFDELKEKGWRNAYFIVYDTSTTLGETIQHALDCLDEEEDVDGLDKVLMKHFGVCDSEVSYYFDRNGVEDESLWLEIQSSQDILVNSYMKVKEN